MKNIYLAIWVRTVKNGSGSETLSMKIFESFGRTVGYKLFCLVIFEPEPEGPLYVDWGVLLEGGKQLLLVFTLTGNCRNKIQEK